MSQILYTFATTFLLILGALMILCLGFFIGKKILRKGCGSTPDCNPSSCDKDKSSCSLCAPKKQNRK